MKSFLVAIVFAVLLSAVVSAQSGRRVAAPPTPVPVQGTRSDEPQYSESKSSDRRSNRPVMVPTRPVTTADTATKVEAADQPVEGETLKIETNLITIPVSVFDQYGLYIPGIRQSEFKIFEDGVEQEIAYFATTDKPITVALVLDVSPSTSYRIQDIRRAASAFVDKLKPQDSVIVMEFDHSVNVLAKVTTDREKIYKAINKADFGDGTSLYNAVDEALRKQLAPIQGRKAVVLFTDGVDTTSRKNSYDSTLSYAEESDALIFPIYYNTYFDNQRRNAGGIFGGIFGPIGGDAESYARGRTYLEELADATGGRVFRPESTPGGLSAAFEGIAEELRRQYNIGYIPKEEGKPGQRKRIKVRVERPSLIIRARDSYVVGSNVAPAAEAAKPPDK